MSRPIDPRVHAGVGARELDRISAFDGAAAAVRLPFELQESKGFLALFGLFAAALAGVACAIDPLVGGALVVAVAAALWVALRPMVGLVLLAAVTPAASGLARGFPVPGLRISEIVAGGAGAIMLLAARRTVRWTPLDWLALLYAVTTLVMGGYDVAKGGDPVSGEDLGLLVGAFQFLLLYRAVLIATDTPERRRQVIRLLLLASVPVALITLLQQFNLFGMRAAVVTMTGTDIYEETPLARATGPFPHWHNLAGYLFMILLLLGALVIRKVPRILPMPVLAGIALLDGIALVETLSIAPVAGLVAGLLMLAVWLGGFARVLLALAVALLAVALIFAPRLEERKQQQFTGKATSHSTLVPATLAYRYDLWNRQVLPLLGNGRWVTGYGPRLPAEIGDFAYTESMYLTFIFRGGIVLLLAWIALVVAMIRAGITSVRSRDPVQQALGATVAISLVCLFPMQLIESYFVYSGPPHVLWTLLALLAFREVPRRREVVAHTPPEQRSDPVSAAMGTLDADRRHLLELAYRDGLSDDELITRFGISAEAVGRRRAEAVHRLVIGSGVTAPEVERALRSEHRSVARPL